MKVTRPPAKHPLPPHAHKVFSGEIFDVYQWEQQLFDGTNATFEKIKRLDTVGVVAVTPDQKLLLCHQEQPGMAPFVETFGGRVDPGEDPFLAAQRELLEESGYQSAQWKFWQATQPFEKIDWAIYTFVAQNCQLVQDQALEGGEKISVFTATFEEFIDYTQQPNFRDAELTNLVLQALAYPEKMTALKQMLFA